jgi:hypothetical protein
MDDDFLHYTMIALHFSAWMDRDKKTSTLMIPYKCIIQHSFYWELSEIMSNDLSLSINMHFIIHYCDYCKFLGKKGKSTYEMTTTARVHPFGL